MKKYVLSVLACAAIISASAQYSFVQHQYNIPGGIVIHHTGIGDFNGDGKNDVLTCSGNYAFNTSGFNFYVFMSNSADSLNAVPVTIPFTHPFLNTQVAGLNVADMNNDALADVVLAVGDTIYIYYQTPQHHLVLSSKTNYAGTTIMAMTVADIDSDGYKDIIIGSHVSAGAMQVLYGNSVADSFTRFSYPAVNDFTADIKTGYADNSGKLLIVTVPSASLQTKTVVISHINHTRTMDTVFNLQTPTFGGYMQSVDFGDRFDNGKTEIVAVGNDLLNVWDNPDINQVSDSTQQYHTSLEAVYLVDLNCSGYKQIVAAMDNQIEILAPGNTTPERFPANINVDLDYDDMAANNVLGKQLTDIILCSGPRMVILENTSAEIVDSVWTRTVYSGYDTSYTIGQGEEWITDDTVYHSNDTAIVAHIDEILTPAEKDSIVLTIQQGYGTGHCAGDTFNLADSSGAVYASGFFTDTSIISTWYETIIATGIKTVSFPDVTIYPDPFTTGINISGVSGEFNIEIYNETGQLVTATYCSGNCIVPRNNLLSGVYLLRISNGENIAWRKIVAL